MRWLCCHSLEEGVAEHAIGFCRTIEIADPYIECRGIDDAGRECLVPHGFNHPRERFPRETVDQIILLQFLVNLRGLSHNTDAQNIA